MKKTHIAIVSFTILVVSIFFYIVFFSNENDLSYLQSPRNNSSNVSENLEINLVGPRWVLERLSISENEIIFPRVHEEFTIKFTEEGKLQGTTDCNNFSSSFTKNENKINFGIFALTQKYCDGSQEEVFLESMREVNEFYFDNKGSLVLKSEDSLIIFVDKESIQNKKNWNLIKEAALNCNIEKGGQTHDKKVKVTLKNGTEIEAYSPEIDNIFDIIGDNRDRCGDVILYTE